MNPGDKVKVHYDDDHGDGIIIHKLTPEQIDLACDKNQDVRDMRELWKREGLYVVSVIEGQLEVYSGCYLKPV